MIAGLFPFVVLIILFWIAFKLWVKQPAPLKPFFLAGMLFKITGGLALGYVYFYHYGDGDTIVYWQDGNRIADKLREDFTSSFQSIWNDDMEGLINTTPRSVFFVKIAGILSFISFGNYWIMTALISFVSFLPAWYLFRNVLKLLQDSKWSVSSAFLFLPSVVFWSSGLIKESLGLASLYFLSGIFLSFYNRDKILIGEWIMAVVSVWIGWNLKYYWIGIFLPVMLTTGAVILWIRYQPSMKRVEVLLWLGLLFILLASATSVHPNFYPDRIFEVIYENNQAFLRLTKEENAIRFNELQPTLQSMLYHSPQALLSGCFRPFFWESHDFLSLMAGIENFIVLLLVVTSLISVGHSLRSPHRLLALAGVVYSAMLAVFLALSTPNFGTLSRYKIGFLPFLVFILLYKNPIWDWWLRRTMKS